MDINNIDIDQVWDEKFPAKFFSGKRWPGGRRTLTVKEVTFENMAPPEQEEDEKFVLWFRDDPRGLGLNVTNKNEMVAMFGKFPRDWIGKQVELFTISTQTGRGIRVCEAPQQAVASPAPPETPVQATAPATLEDTGRPIDTYRANDEEQDPHPSPPGGPPNLEDDVPF